MSTPEEKVVEAMARPLEGRRTTLQRERAALVQAPERIIEIDAELTQIETELAALAPRRPPRQETISV